MTYILIVLSAMLVLLGVLCYALKKNFLYKCFKIVSVLTDITALLMVYFVYKIVSDNVIPFAYAGMRKAEIGIGVIFLITAVVISAVTGLLAERLTKQKKPRILQEFVKIS